MTPAGLLCSLLFVPAFLVAPQNSNWDEVRQIAESQHEIVMLLIEKGQYDKVPKAAREIFQLRFPESEEPRMVKEAQVLTNALLHHNQTAIAHQVLDSALTAVKSANAKSRLHREKAYVYKKEGKTDEAMAEFETSVRLESGKPE